MYVLLANSVALFHLLYVVIVIALVPLILIGRWQGWSWVSNFWIRVMHLVMIGVVVLEVACGWTCPLTTWEQALREKAGQSAYEGDFVANWVHDLLFIDAPPWAFAVAYTAFGAAVALSWWWWPPRGKQRPPPPTDPAT